MWESFKWKSGAQMQHLKTFVFSIGKRYQDLEPDAGLVQPNATQNLLAYEGWAFASRTRDRNILFAYFENGCPRSLVRGAKTMSIYRARWFDPRQGTWQDVGNGRLAANNTGEIQLPDFPGELDWGLSLVYQGPAPMPDHF
jgi:hypothetical protein